MVELALNNFAPFFDPIERIDQDLIDAFFNRQLELTKRDIRYAIKLYYSIQKGRVATTLRIKDVERKEMGEPISFTRWIEKQASMLEGQVQRALAAWVKTNDLAKWAVNIIGIGPVFSAGLCAFIDVNEAPNPSSVWRYAGLDPTCVWKKKTKRPWNATLKTLCWKIGNSFVNVSGNPESTGGQIYKKRKAYEVDRNDRGLNAEECVRILKKKDFGKDTKAKECYKNGFFPPAHVHSRAIRYTAKKFLVAFWEMAWRAEFNGEPPKPYIIDILGHSDYLKASDWR